MQTSKKYVEDSYETSEEDPKTKFTIDIAVPELTWFSYLFPNPKNYMSWKTFFKQKRHIKSLIFNPTWNKFYGPRLDMLNEINTNMQSYTLKNINPPPALTFNATNMLNFEDVKVVIIGQDPYPNALMAIGQSFSIPVSMEYNARQAGSLIAIFNNMKHFKHIKKIPTGGCLTYLILQGCLMINASLTCYEGETKNAHSKTWEEHTSELIEFLNDELDHIVFLVWGKAARLAVKNVDQKKHLVVCSTHPSGQSCHTTARGENGTIIPAFNDVDHFGKANNFLIKHKKEPICWDMIC